MMRQAMLQSLIQQFATLMITFSTGMVIARLLSPHEVGVYSVSWALVAIAGPLKDFGISQFVISNDQVDNKLLSVAYGASVLTSFIFMVAVFFLSWPAAVLYKSPEVGKVLKIIAFSQITPLATPATILLTREMRFGALCNVAVLAGMCNAAVAISLAYFGWSSLGLAWGYFVGNFVTVVCSILYKPNTISLRPTLTGSGRLFSFGGWLTGSAVVGTIGVQAPELAIGRVLSLADAAFFSQAGKINSIIRNIFYYAVMRPALPGLSAQEHAGESLAPLYLRIIEAVTGIAWPAYAVLGIWAGPLIALLYGPKWAISATVVPAIALSYALPLGITPHYDPLIIKRRVSILFFSEAGIALITLCVVPIGAFIGLQAAAWVLIVPSSCFVVWYYYVLKPLVGFSLRSLYKVWGRSLTLTISVAFVVAAVRSITPTDHPIVILLGLMASGVLGGLAWLVAIWLTGHEFGQHIDVLSHRARAWLARRWFHA